MDKLIEQNPTKEHKKYKKEIERLQTEKEKLKKDYTNKIELQETIIAEKNRAATRVTITLSIITKR